MTLIDVGWIHARPYIFNKLHIFRFKTQATRAWVFLFLPSIVLAVNFYLSQVGILFKPKDPTTNNIFVLISNFFAIRKLFILVKVFETLLNIHKEWLCSIPLYHYWISIKSVFDRDNWCTFVKLLDVALNFLILIVIIPNLEGSNIQFMDES